LAILKKNGTILINNPRSTEQRLQIQKNDGPAKSVCKWINKNPSSAYQPISKNLKVAPLLNFLTLPAY